MLKTERTIARPHATTRRPERLAWLILLSSFGIFCLLVGTAGTVLYYWLSQPEVGPIAAQVTQPLAVQVQRAGMIRKEILQDHTLNPGDRVIISAEATPGQAAVLRFRDVSVALWAGTEVLIGNLGAQWNDPSAADARLLLDSGQMLVQLTGNTTVLQIDIGGDLGGPPVVLRSPGRYLIRILDEHSPTTALAEHGIGRGLEVATEIGMAQVGQVEVQRGARLLEIGERGVRQQVARLTRWDLLRDGSFQQLVDSDYGRVPSTDVPWKRTGGQIVEGEAGSGQVQPTQECIDPIARTDCDDPYVRLVRKGGNTKGYVTAIQQSVEADVGAHRSVKLIADVKVVYQSLSKAGESGVECPLLIRVNYTNHFAQNVQKDYCFWAFEYPNQNGVVSTLPYIETQQLLPNRWHTFEVDLKDDLPELVEIREISFQANGHDYESHIRNVRLVAEGLSELK